MEVAIDRVRRELEILEAPSSIGGRSDDGSVIGVLVTFCTDVTRTPSGPEGQKWLSWAHENLRRHQRGIRRNVQVPERRGVVENTRLSRQLRARERSRELRCRDVLWVDIEFGAGPLGRHRQGSRQPSGFRAAQYQQIRPGERA